MAKNPVSTLSKVKSFVTQANNNGAKGLALIAEAIEHNFTHNDWTPMAWLIGKLESKDAAIVRRIIGECIEKAKMVKDEGQPSGYKFVMSSETRKSNKFSVLMTLVENGASFRGKAVAEHLFDKKEAAEFDESKAIDNLLKRLAKESVDIESFARRLVIRKKENDAKLAEKA